MESMSNLQVPSPRSSSSSSSNGHAAEHFPTALLPPKPDGTPYPTTFVQADSSSFKQVVQMLTGCSDPASQPSPNHPVPPLNTKHKLYERRNKSLHINPLLPSLFNAPAPAPAPAPFSPSLLDFPSLVLSPVTPLIPDPFARSLDTDAEDRAIKEKGFYLHPSPATTPSARARDAEPRLLPLFPTTSPKASSSST